MNFSDEIKIVRQRAFMSQTTFANTLAVSFSTVNRWETGKTCPNLDAMKKIKDFCIKNEIPYCDLENSWLINNCKK